MKTYRTSRDLVASIEQSLHHPKPSNHNSPLDEVLDLLVEGRHYSWAGIHLATGTNVSESGHHLARMALAQSRAKILVAIKLASHEFGVLAVESDQEYGIGPEDRILLERVAGLLARFFAGPGRYIVRQAAMLNSRAGSAPSA